MRNLKDSTAKKAKPFILATFVICCASISLIIAAIFTEFWFEADCKDPVYEESFGKLNVGLFSGYSKLEGLTVLTRDYEIICSDGDCMYSRYSTKTEREASLIAIQSGTTCDICNNDVADVKKTVPWVTNILQPLMLLVGIDEKPTYEQKNAKFIPADVREAKDDGETSGTELMSEGLWISTIVFLGLALFFAAVGAIFAVYNTSTVPIRAISGIPGLYLWNLLAAISVLIGIICWAVEYNDHMTKNIILEDGTWTTVGDENLGYSFWLIVLSVVLHATNGVIIFIGTYESKVKPKFQAPESKDGNYLIY